MDTGEEIRGGYKISSKMRNVWAIQLRMVQKLLDVCNRHHLKIWADGGTLLGLVREHGYIPWDDDIDMLMFREDYDKLVSIAPQEFKSPFFFQNAFTDKNYFKGHSQLRYDGTAAILEIDINQPFHQGIFIDIFVYDSIPDVKDSEWRRRLKTADRIFDSLFQYSYGTRITSNLPKILYSPFNYINCKRNKPMDLYRRYEDLFREYNTKSCQEIACPCFSREIFKTSTKLKDWYRETIYLPFEDIKLPAPIDYDKVLRKQYGDDYMIPRKKRTMHGSFAVLDPYHSYTDYLPTLKEEYKKIRWKRFYKKIIKKLFHIK